MWENVEGRKRRKEGCNYIVISEITKKEIKVFNIGLKQTLKTDGTL